MEKLFFRCFFGHLYLLDKVVRQFTADRRDWKKVWEGWGTESKEGGTLCVSDKQTSSGRGQKLNTSGLLLKCTCPQTCCFRIKL